MNRFLNHRRSFVAISSLSLLLGLLLGVGVAQTAADPGFSSQIRLMRDLLGLIDDVNKIAASPSMSGVMAVMGAKDQLKNNEEAIAFLEKLLPQVNDPVVQRAIRIQLSDYYKNTGQRDKAIQQLERLIVNRPAAN